MSEKRSTIGRPVRRLRRYVGMKWLLGTLPVVAVVLGVASPGTWAATAGPSLRLAAAPAPGNAHTVDLVATLQEPAGQSAAALSGISVDFEVHIGEFAGAPLLDLGSATTDAAGRAVLTYQPTWTGSQSLVATATDSSGNTLASATTSLTAAVATTPFAGAIESVRPDGTIGQAVVGVLLAIVVAVWIALIAIVVRVNLGLHRRGVAHTS
ncbi:MAG: hypothetical protein M0Z63_03665 [Actinomycetota bacterium]|nr:hypothetical protein [Actinomycetota bacterium]MDA8279509.1 hypothetical protein [Actinomycetota bacterium]